MPLLIKTSLGEIVRDLKSLRSEWRGLVAHLATQGEQNKLLKAQLETERLQREELLQRIEEERVAEAEFEVQARVKNRASIALLNKKHRREKEAWKKEKRALLRQIAVYKNQPEQPMEEPLEQLEQMIDVKFSALSKENFALVNMVEVLNRKVEEHGEEIKRLRQARSEESPPPPPPVARIPPPPPPPPPPPSTANIHPRSKSRGTEVKREIKPLNVDPRAMLLAEIRKGIKLRPTATPRTVNEEEADGGRQTPSEGSSGVVPPPPPPPPPTSSRGIPPPPTQSPTKDPQASPKDEETKDPRSRLMEEIRAGIRLRPTSHLEKELPTKREQPEGIAAVLARALQARAAFIQDSSDEEPTSEEDDEDIWE